MCDTKSVDRRVMSDENDGEEQFHDLRIAQRNKHHD
jgi:hypothetical protein